MIETLGLTESQLPDSSYARGYRPRFLSPSPNVRQPVSGTVSTWAWTWTLPFSALGSHPAGCGSRFELQLAACCGFCPYPHSGGRIPAVAPTGRLSGDCPCALCPESQSPNWSLLGLLARERKVKESEFGRRDSRGGFSPGNYVEGLLTFVSGSAGRIRKGGGLIPEFGCPLQGLLCSCSLCS